MIKKNIARVYMIFKYGIVWNKPIYIFRLIKNYFKIALVGFKPLRGIDFAITYACNMKCKHCFDETLKKPGCKEMSVQDYRMVAKQAMDLGCIHFGFQGGEMFLRKDYPEIIKAVCPSKNKITVTSNGLLMDEKLIRELKALKVDYINFSIDSGIADEHDKFRQVPGSFKKDMEAIALCKKLGMKFTINTTISHQSIRSEGFEKILKIADENKVLINTLFAAPAGNWENNKSVVLDKNDKEHYYKIKAEHPFAVREIESGYRGRGCPMVKEVLYITPYGDVLGCPFIQISLGNVLNNNLKSIREKGLKDKYFSVYHKSCLIAEDSRFIEKYLSSFDKNTQLPLPLEKVNW